MAWGCALPCCIDLRVCGPGCYSVHLRLHVSLVAFIALSLMQEISLSHVDFGKIFVTLIYASLGITLSALITTVAQLSAAACCGCKPKAIVIWPIGGIPVYERPPARHRHRFFIALVGLVFNLVITLVWYGLLRICGCDLGLDVKNTYCTFNPLTREKGVSPDYPKLWMWAAQLAFQMTEYNVLLLAFQLSVPVVPLAAATLLTSGLQICCATQRIVANLALVISTLVLFTLVCLWITVLILTSFKNLSILAAFTAVYLAWQTWTLRGAMRSDDPEKLSRHPLFALRGPSDDGNSGPGGRNGNLSQSLVADGGWGDAPSPERKSWFGGRSSTNTRSATLDAGAVSVTVTPDQVAHGAAWAARNPGTVAAAANVASSVAANPFFAPPAPAGGEAAGGRDGNGRANPFYNNAHLS